MCCHDGGVMGWLWVDAEETNDRRNAAWTPWRWVHLSHFPQKFTVDEGMSLPSSPFLCLPKRTTSSFLIIHCFWQLLKEYSPDTWAPQRWMGGAGVEVLTVWQWARIHPCSLPLAGTETAPLDATSPSEPNGRKSDRFQTLSLVVLILLNHRRQDWTLPLTVKLHRIP